MSRSPDERLRRARWAVTYAFFGNGILYASLAARMPAVRDHAGVSNGQLGLALAAIAAGSILAMPLSGVLCARMGSRVVVRAALPLACAAIALPPLAASLPALAGAFLLFGMASGALDVAMNAHGVAIERELGRPVLGALHAFFSFGALAGAGAGTLAAAADVDLQLHAVLVSVIVGGAAVAAGLALLPAAADRTGGSRRVLARPPRRLWALGALAFAALLVEGGANDWSAVYVRDEAGAGATVAALAFLTFTLTMAAGRLAGDWLVARRGAPELIRGGGILAGAGLGAALLVGTPAVAFAGLAALGIGIAVIVPVAFRAAGTEGAPSAAGAAGAAPAPAPGVALAAVATMGYLGFVVGPPVIGGLAGLASLPAALCLLVVLCFAAAALSRAAQPAT